MYLFIMYDFSLHEGLNDFILLKMYVEMLMSMKMHDIYLYDTSLFFPTIFTI